MIYKIYNSDADTLLEQPETGMGYQIVNARQYNRYTIKKMVVYNSNLAVDLDTDFISLKQKIITEGYSKVLRGATELMLETDSIRVLTKSELGEINSVSETRQLYKTSSNEKGAKENLKEYANGEEVFVRISAYEDDKRIDFKKKKLKKGSFTTTKFDYNECVQTDDNPIDRYALPNDEEIKWAFYIKPKSNDQLQRGKVQPAFGRNGGGVEAYFEEGTSNDTYLNKKEYGK